MSRHPSKLDANGRQKILGYLRAGKSRRHACRLLGIDRETLRKRTLADANFRQQVEDAWDSGLDVMEDVLRDAANGVGPKRAVWQAALVQLERRRPEKWAKRNPDYVTAEQFDNTIHQLISVMQKFISTEQLPEVHDAVAQVLPQLDAK